jgi:hypothetical protein
METNTPNRLAPNKTRVIVPLQRGFVATGIYYQKGDVGKLKKAAIVRRWGTTEGLGQLAEEGPLKNTILDYCPNITFHIREAIFIMECSNAWGE